MSHELQKTQRDDRNQNGRCAPVVEANVELLLAGEGFGFRAERINLASKQESGNTAGASGGVCCSDVSSSLDSQALNFLSADTARGVAIGCGCHPNGEVTLADVDGQGKFVIDAGNVSVVDFDGSQGIDYEQFMLTQSQSGSDENQPAGANCCGGNASTRQSISLVASDNKLNTKQNRHEDDKGAHDEVAERSKNFGFGHEPILAGTSKIQDGK